MNFGSHFTPVSFFTPAAPPATVTGANNGVSLSGTNVVLGNSVGGLSAQLLSNREIETNAFSITFKNTGTLNTVITANQIVCTNTSSGLLQQGTFGAGFALLTDRNTNQPFIRFRPANNLNTATVINNNGIIGFQDQLNIFKLRTDIITGDTIVAGTIKTGDGNLGDPPAQPWNLGQAVIAGPGLTLNQNVLVEVCINGVQWNLATVNLPA